jgi:hypothetical protein
MAFDTAISLTVLILLEATKIVLKFLTVASEDSGGDDYGKSIAISISISIAISI